MKFKVVIPRLDLLQALDDQGSGVADTPSTSDAEASDNPASPQIGIGIGGFGVGGDGGDDEIEMGRGHSKHE